MSEVADPTCRECGTAVAVEGYAELPAKYQESIRRMILCDRCGAEEEKRAEEEVRAERRAIYEAAVSDTQLPAKLRGKRWSDLDFEEPNDIIEGNKLIATAAQAKESRERAAAACRSWAAGETRGLVLAGRVGLGKSFFAAVAAQSRVHHLVAATPPEKLRPMAPLRWVTVPTLIQKSRGDYGSDRRRDAEKILDGTFGLVLDDIDKVKPTEFSLDLLFEAIENRVNRGRSLLVTTNANYKELTELLGDPITSRLREHCVGVRMFGRDRRK